MKSIKTLKSLKGKTVLLRADFNVPMVRGKITDDFRIKKTLPTIKLLRTLGARVIIISHIGDDGSQSLRPVAKYLNKYIPVTFVPSVIGSKVTKAIAALKSRGVLLLENLRTEDGEKKNDAQFAQTLASYADIYVNDAFSVSHRAHASVVGVTKLLPHYAGLQLVDEVKHLSVVVEKPKHPFLFILGGAKFETKLPLLKRYQKSADMLYIGGALTNEIWQEEGVEVGTSRVDPEDFGLEHIERNPKIHLPSDVLVRRGKKQLVVKKNAITKDEQIVDIGTNSEVTLLGLIKKAKLIVWNGPLGLYESGFGGATEKTIRALAKSKKEVIIGGGDTVALISKLKLEKKFTFVSTGGGATLEFLAEGTLPGIEALK